MNEIASKRVTKIIEAFNKLIQFITVKTSTEIEKERYRLKQELETLKAMAACSKVDLEEVLKAHKKLDAITEELNDINQK